MRSRTIGILAVLSFFIGLLALGRTEQGKEKKDSLDKDYAAELPRIKPKEPGEALTTFKPRPGFRVELVAAEPLIRSPVAIDFDEDGRLFLERLDESTELVRWDAL